MKKHLFGLIVAILAASVSWYFFQWSRIRTANTPTNQSLSNASVTNFRDVCDCFVLVEESGLIERIEVAIGKRQPLLSPDAQRLVAAYSWAAYSPDGRQLALVSTDNSSVHLIDTLSGEVAQAYSALSGDAIISLVWAGNGKKFVASVGSRASADVPTALSPNRLVLVDVASGAAEDAVVVADYPNLASLIQGPMFVSHDGGMIFFADSNGKQWQWRSDSSALVELPSAIDFRVSFSEEDSSPIYARIIGDQAVFGYRTKIRIVSLADFSEKVIEINTATDQPYSEPNHKQDSLLLVQTNEQGSAAKLVRLSLPSGAMTTVLDPYPANSGLADFHWTPDGSSFVFLQYAGAETYVGQLLDGKVVLKNIRDAPTGIRAFVSKPAG